MEIGKIATKKSLGQHWLVDQVSLDYIIVDADLNSNDVVLEIGPGTGNLTRLMAPKVKKIIAVELDESLLENLKNMNIANMEIIHQDILSFNLSELPKKYKIVANIPYYLTSKLIRLISESNNPPELAILLVQKEIAERLSAKHGDYSILGLTAQYYWNVESMQLVPADRFDPPPKVDSQIVRLSRKDKLELNEKEEKKLFRLIRTAFASKRKTLVNNLKNGYPLNRMEIEDILGDLDINKMIRPQDLKKEDWIKILEKINRYE